VASPGGWRFVGHLGPGAGRGAVLGH
jgi:hypothetical protein